MNLDKDSMYISGFSRPKCLTVWPDNFPKLATFSIVLGVMYMISCVIEVFGTVAAVTASFSAHSHRTCKTYHIVS